MKTSHLTPISSVEFNKLKSINLNDHIVVSSPDKTYVFPSIEIGAKKTVTLYKLRPCIVGYNVTPVGQYDTDFDMQKVVDIVTNLGFVEGVHFIRSDEPNSNELVFKRQDA